jgi:OmcA/MtrC family decaheme c-type cytochrome
MSTSRKSLIGVCRKLIGLGVITAASLAAGCSGSNGSAGKNGANGDAGVNGTSCSVTDNHDGTATIRCSDGTSATVSNGANGDAGINGTSCTLTSNDAGTRTISCGDAGGFTVLQGVVDYVIMTPDERMQAAMSAVITSVTVPADGRPLVNIKVSERHGYGVKNLSSVAGVTWRFSLLKLAAGVNGSANDTWVSYLAANDHTVASAETAAAANLTDNGDGTYVYRLAQVINGGATAAGTTYEADKVHRLIVLLYASGNPFTPINLVKEFIPMTGMDVTGQNDKVDQNACLECHTTFRAIAGGTGELGSGEFHGGVRYDVRTCVACHNDQRRFSSTGTSVTEPGIAADGTWTGAAGVINDEAVINLPVFIHKIHMGNKLTLTGGTYAGVPQPYETTYPQDVRNCVKCHRSPAPKADNWKTSISRRACGACHDDKSFDATIPNARVMHSGGMQADDSKCTVCHAAGSVAGDVPSKHLSVSPPNPHNIYLDQSAAGNSNTNAASVAAVGLVPPGAKVITYDLQSVALNSSRNPQAVFRFMIADPTATPPVAATPVVLPTAGAGTTELIPNFVGGPSVYFVYALPQDGISSPADFNASASGYIRNIWNGTATGAGGGTLTGPDTNGYYTITLTGVTVPATATMLSGGIGYTYGLGSAPTFSSNTQPFTEIDLAAYPYTANTSGFAGKGGLIVPPPDVWKVATGFTGRRAIVDNSKCSTCHVTLGVGPDFHAGQRNDSSSCAWCHKPNQTSSAWSANAKDFIHSIHGAEKRSVNFNWHAESATEGFWETTYPGVLNKCEMCHLPGTYDYSLASTTSAYPNMLYSTVGQGRYNSNAVTNPLGYFMISPYVTSDNTVDYGFGYSTGNVNATLPDGISGTQTVGGTTANCTPSAPCVCNATNPCSVTISGPYTVNNTAVNFTQKIGTTTSPCNSTTSCTCTTAQPCTGVVATCSLTAPCSAQGTTLVSSPIVAACSACHDSAIAIDHMQTNGGSFYEPRSTAFTKPQKEECLLCHGPGRLASIADRHAVQP